MAREIPEIEFGFAVGDEEACAGTLIVPELGLFGVARGTGGFCRGADAVRITLDVAERQLRSAAEPSDDLCVFAAALRRSSDEVYAAQYRPYRDEQERIASQQHIGHGCSAAILGLTRLGAVGVNSGDCAIFHYRPHDTLGGGFTRLSCSHTVHSRVLAASNFHQDILAGEVGMRDAWIDAFERPHMPHDVFLLATDIIGRRVSPADLCAIMTRSEQRPASDVAKAIVEACRLAHLNDRDRWYARCVAVVVVRLVGQTPRISVATERDAERVRVFYLSEHWNAPESQRGTFVLIAEWCGQIVGAASLACNAERANLGNTVVSRAWGAFNLERVLLDTAIREARRLGIQAIHAWVVPCLADLYKEKGFAPCATTAPAIERSLGLRRASEPAQDAIAMVRVRSS